MATEKSKYISEEFSNLFGKLLRELDLADVKKLLTYFDMVEKDSEINSTLDFLIILSNSGKFSSDNVSDLLTALQKSDMKTAERSVKTYLQKTSK
ncbi:hypothetical protein HOLleu_44566 [Holothuria leucospilota]|uniref:Uncharacterized protein n=1 Tax=Holothuria leucospilota TaxID=206669 RepID=A0A9Q1BA43_HOLLE|nr:hypothetical protein HOLleu_44566 [Holothuria leucospilota]